MLQSYVKRSASEQYSHVSKPPSEDGWIVGSTISDADIITLEEKYQLDRTILRDVLDLEELPRVEIHEPANYVFLRTVRRSKHGRVVTAPLLLVTTGSTFMELSSDSGQEIREIDNEKFPHSSPKSLLQKSLNRVISDYETLIQRTGHSIKDTGGRLRTHDVTNDDFIRFVTAEDNLNDYRMNLSGMLVVTEHLKAHSLVKKDTDAFEDTTLHIRQLLVAIESYNQNIVSIRNAYGTIANNVLNQRMKTLTVLTLLVALPNLFYGMYGMNVILPFQDESWAYLAVVGFTLLILVLVYGIARRLRLL